MGRRRPNWYSSKSGISAVLLWPRQTSTQFHKNGIVLGFQEELFFIESLGQLITLRHCIVLQVFCSEQIPTLYNTHVGRH
jgi:hypothetical protein